VRAAIDFLARAEPVDAPAALRLGLVDALADSCEAAEAMAIAWVLDPSQRAAAGHGRVGLSVDPADAQAAAAIALAALPGRRRAAVALAAVASAWASDDRAAAAATEWRRATDLAAHADTRAWLSTH